MSVSIRKGLRGLIRTTSTADNPPSGQRALIAKSDGWYDRDASGAEVNLTPTTVPGALANTTVTGETVVATFSLPANALVAGSLWEVVLLGQVSSTATLTWRVRIGTAGTTADATALTFATTAAGVANAYTMVSARLACLTTGTTGTLTASGQAQLASGVVGPATAAYAATSVNTTVALKVTITVTQSTAQTHTTRVGVLAKRA